MSELYDMQNWCNISHSRCDKNDVITSEALMDEEHPDYVISTDNPRCMLTSQVYWLGSQGLHAARRKNDVSPTWHRRKWEYRSGGKSRG